MGSLANTAKKAYKSYVTFGASDLSEGKAPYQEAAEEAFPVPEIPTPPVPEAVKAMPTPDDEAIKAAKRKEVLLQRRRRGRRSTILSETGDLTTLGG